jgi:hypothetical protein
MCLRNFKTGSNVTNAVIGACGVVVGRYIMHRLALWWLFNNLIGATLKINYNVSRLLACQLSHGLKCLVKFTQGAYVPPARPVK